MSRVATAVVGVGTLGAEHARVLSELGGSRLVGVHDRRPERAAAVARKHGTRAFRRMGALLARADAVVVAVPTRAHHEVGRAVLESGCHVLVEKPLAPTLREVDDLLAAARRRDRCLCVGRVERFNPAVLGGRRFVDRPRFLVAERLAPFQRRGTDVGVVLDLMIHDLDLALWLADAPVRDVDAVGISVLTNRIDLANARLTFADGAVAQITASRVAGSGIRRLRAFQRDGCLSLDLAAGEGEFLHRPASGASTRASLGAPAGTDRRQLGRNGREPLRLEVEAFLARLRGERAGSVTAAEARPALELALRITSQIEESSHVAA